MDDGIVLVVVTHTKNGVGFLSDEPLGPSRHGKHLLWWNLSEKDRADAYVARCRRHGIDAHLKKMTFSCRPLTESGS